MKLDRENRIFQQKWEDEYIFTEFKGKPMCLVCLDFVHFVFKDILFLLPVKYIHIVFKFLSKQMFHLCFIKDILQKIIVGAIKVQI